MENDGVQPIFCTECIKIVFLCMKELIKCINVDSSTRMRIDINRRQFKREGERGLNNC